MKLNLTDNQYSSGDVYSPEGSEAISLFSILGDIPSVEEAALLIASYEPNLVILDESDEYLLALQDALEKESCDIELTLGVHYECA